MGKYQGKWLLVVSAIFLRKIFRLIVISTQDLFYFWQKNNTFLLHSGVIIFLRLEKC